MKNLGKLLLALFLVHCVDVNAQNNVLLIIADDLGVDYLQSYNLGNDPAPTPVIDSLAANGLQFANAWTNPICSPSRANILTGKYAFRTGIGTAITGNGNTSLDTAEYTLPKSIKAQSNASTAMVGKWHLGHHSQSHRINPNKCGFDHYEGSIGGQLENYFYWSKTTNGSQSLQFNKYATSVAVDDAIEWVDDQSNNWFLALTFNAPHVPFHKPPNNLHSFDTLSSNLFNISQNPIPYFKAMVESMDTEIGRFLSHLSLVGELANTDIIFIGDNGTDSDVVQAPFIVTHSKGTMYNGGVQVPLIISGPSVVQSGREDDVLVNSTDLYHTILELMGGNISNLPADVATDSRSLMSVINNANDTQNHRDWIYGDLFRPIADVKDGKAISDGTYKLIYFDNGITEFYNIKTDYHEENGLDIDNLTSIEQNRFDYLCSEISTLVDTSFCEISVNLFDQTLMAFKIYPNPTTDRINLQLESLIDINSSKAFQAIIIDSKGTIVQRENLGTNREFIKVDGLSKGKYQLIIENNNQAIGVASFMKM